MPETIQDTTELSEKSPWRALEYLNYYRLVLTGLILIFIVIELLPVPFGKNDPTLFERVIYFYFAIAIGFVFTNHYRKPGYIIQTYIQVLVDIVAITLMFHASGPDSGIGLLLVVAIAGGSLLVPGLTAYFFAAVATLSLFFEQFYSQLNSLFESTYYSRTGMLGVVFFATAILSHALASRIRKSEALAAQRGIDVANLAELNEHIIQRMQVGILVVDDDNKIRLGNAAAKVLLGIYNFEQQPSLETAAPQIFVQLQKWQKNPDTESMIIQSTETTASIIPRFARLGQSRKQGALIFLEDAAAMKQQAHHLKLASLGRLTASIAHEIRNPLSAISHAGQLLEESADIAEKDKRLTEIIRNHAKRMNGIIENILQLSRQDRAQPELFNLKPWLKEFVSEFTLTNHIADKEILLTIEDETEVRFDPEHLHQILWNLCQNSLRHSTDYAGNPKLELTAGVEPETKRPFLDVRDHGSGIDPATVNQIFEPFFTTESKGTGLGLFIARELCETNRARLDLVQGNDRGACFRIIFADPRRRQGI